MLNTAYEMRMSDWSSDVCSSDLRVAVEPVGNGIAVRRYRSRRHLDLVHDQRHRGDHLCDVCRLRRQAGRAARSADGLDPERHPEGICRARDVDLAGAAVDAADRRHDRSEAHTSELQSLMRTSY